MKTLRFPLFGLAIGLLGFFTYQTVYSYEAPRILPTIQPIISSSASTTKQPPTRVAIPKLNKNIVVQASIINGNDWEVFDTTVAWLSTSALPGEGNVILYAHAWESLWGDLYTLQSGDTIEVYQNEVKTRYIVTESKAVDPHDIDSVLSNENRLTLFTCEGSFDQKRRVVYATPE